MGIDEKLFKVSQKELSGYQEALRAIPKGNKRSGEILVCTTPFAYQELGFPLGVFTIKPSVIHKGMGVNHQGSRQGHAISRLFMENLPNNIANPLFIMKSSDIAKEKQKNDSFVIFSDFMIEDRPVVIPFVLEPVSTRLGNYSICSIYERNIFYNDKTTVNKNKIIESLENGEMLYARSIDELYRWIKKESLPYRDMSRPGTIPGTYLGGDPISKNIQKQALLVNQNIQTKEKLLNSFRKKRKETVFIFGCNPRGNGAEKEYNAATSMLSKRGYNVINPYLFKDSELKLEEIANKATMVVFYKSINNGELSKEISPNRLATYLGIPCKHISSLMPVSIADRANFLIAKKDPLSLML